MMETFKCNVCLRMVMGPATGAQLQCGRDTGKYSIRDGDVIPIKCGGKLTIVNKEEIESYVEEK